TLRPVLYATASQERQYGLVERAGTVGWPATQVVLIDDDQGQSGSRAHERPGFQDLRGALALDQVGIVLVLEVARWARNCSEWYRVLEVAALAGPLIGDIDGVYDPRDYHDRLLLGLKGALSEAELYTLKTRLHGGRLTKARQGTLVQMLPVGLVRPREGRVPLDPHLDVQTTVRTVLGQLGGWGGPAGGWRPGRPSAVGGPGLAPGGEDPGTGVGQPASYAPLSHAHQSRLCRGLRLWAPPPSRGADPGRADAADPATGRGVASAGPGGLPRLHPLGALGAQSGTPTPEPMQVHSQPGYAAPRDGAAARPRLLCPLWAPVDGPLWRECRLRL